jgi:tetratricopeptide (TPR) repeat protein
VPALAYLSTAHAERGQFAQVVGYYERAIAADEMGPVPYYLAADALLKFAEVDAARAEKYLARAVEIDPNFASARLALGRLYARQERWEEAAKHLEQAVRFAPQLAARATSSAASTSGSNGRTRPSASSTPFRS